MKKEKQVILTFIFLTGFAMACSSSSSAEGKDEKRENQPKQTTKKAVPEDKQMVFEGPGELLPREVNEFRIASKPRYFGPENLYDLIDGGAEIYTEFGLKKMVTADYKAGLKPNITVTVEIYDQGTLLGAFGRMARFLTGRNDLEGIGNGLPEELIDKGIFGATDLIFYKDHFLAHVTLLDESPEATMETMKQASKDILPVFAAAIAKKIAADPPLPNDFGLFPEENRIARSNAWDPGRTAGIDGLGPAFSWRYSDGKVNFTMLLTQELNEAGSLLTKLETATQGNSNEFVKLKAVKNRIAGLKTFDPLTEKQKQGLTKQLELFAKKIEELN